MSVQLDLITYEIELDIDTSGNITLNLVDGKFVSVFLNGTKLGNTKELDFRNGNGTTAVVTLSNGMSLVSHKLGGTLTENTAIEGAGLYGLTLGHLTDPTKYLSYLYGVVPNTGDIYWAVKNDGTGGETSLYLKGAGGTRAFLVSDNGLLLLTTGGGIASNAATTQQIIAGTTLTLQAATSITSTGSKHSFTPASGYAGLNVGSLAGNPSSLANGDIWYNSSSNELNARINGATVALGAGGGGGTWGSITGTLSNQTDLQSALDGKLATGLARLLTGTNTMTGTVTDAFGSNPWLITSGVTTGTLTTAGMEIVGNALTTGRLVDIQNNSGNTYSTGSLLNVTTNSTAVNHTAGTHAVVTVSTSGGNSTASKTVVGFQSLITNTGTSSTNIAALLSASGATSNFALIVPSTGGNVGIGTLTPTIGRLEVNGNSSGYIQVWRDGTTLRALMTDAGALSIPSSFSFTSGSGTVSAGSGGALSMIAQSTTYTQNVVNATNTFQTWTQSAHTAGSPVLALFTGGAHTGLTASSEIVDINFNLARTVQRATGAVATQRAFRIQAPTYGFVGASTITNAYTLAIDGAPVAGTNATITNSWALGVLGNLVVTGTRVNIANLPTSSAGLATGDLWNDTGTIKVA